MPRQRSSKKSSVKILPISMIIFIVIAILTLLIVLNKGKIGEYSLVKIETSTDSNQESVEETKNKMQISLEKKYLSSKKKEQSEISVKINEEEIDLNEVELTSSNEDVAKIKNGVAVAVSVGKTTITAKKDDLEATADLRVIIPITSITFTSTNSVIKVGKSLQMKLVAKPSDASIESLKYTSSNEEVATVNNNGIVTGVSPGKVTITVTDQYSGIEKSVNLTIKK